MPRFRAVSCLAAIVLCACGGGGGVGGGGAGTPPTTATQIAAARAAADGPASLAIEGAVVTYVKPAVGAEATAFFVQAGASGPALLCAVDPGSLVPGDVVSFTVDEMGTVGGVREATAISALIVTGSGAPTAGLVQDVSAAADLVLAADAYESELVDCQGAVAGDFVADGSGYVSAPFDTAAIVGSANLELRMPFPLASSLGVAAGCVVRVHAVPFGRFGATAQVSAWVAADVTVLTCAAPRVLSALALSPTSFVVGFDRPIDPASVTNGAFAVSGGLMVTANLVNGSDVTLTSTSQAPGTSYTVTVAGSVTDTLGSPVDPTANSAAFTGHQAQAVVWLNEVAPQLSSGDLVELRVVTAGSTNGMSVVANPAPGSSGAATLALLPNLAVAAGDLIVIHLSPGAGVVTETGMKTDCADSACYPGAWDVAGSVTGITYGTRVLAVMRGTTIIDGVPFTTGVAQSSFAVNVQLLQNAGQWLPADSNGAPTTDTSTPTAIQISVDWSGLSSTQSIKRGASDTNQASDWSKGTSSFGS